jgi:hypothetical protein
VTIFEEDWLLPVREEEEVVVQFLPSAKGYLSLKSECAAVFGGALDVYLCKLFTYGESFVQYVGRYTQNASNGVCRVPTVSNTMFISQLEHCGDDVVVGRHGIAVALLILFTGDLVYCLSK